MRAKGTKKQAWFSKQVTVYYIMRECINSKCDNWFEPSESRQWYCSKRCRWATQQRRRRAKLKANDKH